MKKPVVQAMLAARDRAQQTPEEVRAAFLGKRVSAGGLELHSLTLGIVWLFEKLRHPLLEGLTDGQRLSIEQQIQAAFIFAQPSEAHAALSEGIETFDAAAHKLAMNLTPADLNDIAHAIGMIMAEGLATIPGVGGGTQKKTG